MSNESNLRIRKVITGSAWSFIGVLITVIFFYWQEYINPFDFRIELVDEFNLVEIKETINDLEILYKNENILKSHKDIKVVRIRINNAGETILQSYYDQIDQFGLRFLNSRILKAEVIESNSEDLKKKLIQGNSLDLEAGYDDLFFSKVIFDEGDFAELKITLLLPANENLNMIPFGKIANINRLQLSKHKAKVNIQDTSWNSFIFGYFILLVFMLFLTSIMVYLEKRSRKNQIAKFMKKYENLTETQLKIIEIYLEGNSEYQIISSLLREDKVIDLKDFIYFRHSTRLGKILLFFKAPIQFARLPKLIFNVEETKVSLNPENEEFIKLLFKHVLKAFNQRVN